VAGEAADRGRERRGAGRQAQALPKDGDAATVVSRRGRIEGELIEIRKSSERVTALEIWQSWLKGAWAALVTRYLYLYRQAVEKQ